MFEAPLNPYMTCRTKIIVLDNGKIKEEAINIKSFGFILIASSLILPLSSTILVLQVIYGFKGASNTLNGSFSKVFNKMIPGECANWK